MVKVMLWGSLKAAAGGNTEVHVEASNIRQMLNAVAEAHPGLEQVIEQGISVSIDGQMHREGGFEPVTEESEIYLFPKLEGG
ncbi:MAG: MoaD/ThiS family protein [Hyphomicrobiales bacterium]